MKKSDTVAASTLKQLIGERHKNDVFVEECKTGATTTANASVMLLDGWAMKKTWSPPTSIGYEVKVSRGDFLSDNKWPGYLKFCNQFYFVCPWKLISPEELPENVGLMWASTNTNRLFVKRKAPHRNVTVPEDIFRYILMARATISRKELSSAEYWRERYREKSIDKQIGAWAGRQIATEMRCLRQENKQLKERIQSLETIERVAKEIGFHISLASDYRIKCRMRELMDGIPKEFTDALSQLLRQGAEFSKLLESYRISGSSEEFNEALR